LYSGLEASPWGNELTEAFAEAAISGEKLGARGATDLLTVSFSSNDYVGHRVGPDAPEVRDMTIRTDQLLAKLFRFLDARIGLKNVVVVLSADHGVASAPSENQKTKIPGGYLTGHATAAVANALNSRFGGAHWLIDARSEEVLYLDLNTVREKHATLGDLYETARAALLADPNLHVARVYDRSQLSQGIGGDFVATAEQNGFNPRRSGDLFLVYEPGYMAGSGSGTTHFAPYRYDTHVPVLFMGPGIRAGRYDEMIAPNDIAPTLATLLNIQTPSGSSGRPLAEILIH
jgi:predicted AlkP superfamily pyrophosphatase or phosphodiesterase